MKHKALQGVAFIIIGLFLLATLAWMLWGAVVSNPLTWVLIGIIVFCGIVNLVCGALLLQKA